MCLFRVRLRLYHTKFWLSSDPRFDVNGAYPSLSPKENADENYGECIFGGMVYGEKKKKNTPVSHVGTHPLREARTK